MKFSNFLPNSNLPFSFVLPFKEQEQRCDLCWSNITELGNPTPISLASVWMINITNLVYYRRINNTSNQTDGDGYVICDFSVPDTTNDFPYTEIREPFPSDIHPTCLNRK